MLRIAVLALALFWASPAAPGAWPRGAGEAFVSLSAETQADASRREMTGGIYAEYGLTPQLTLGGQFDRNAGAEVFLRRSRSLGGGHVGALSLGGGRTDARPERSFVFGGLHWGKGVEQLPLALSGSGWLSLDGKLAFATDQRFDHAKLDALAGLSLGERWKLMLSLEGYADHDNTFVNLVPSVARRVTGNSHLLLRLIAPLRGGDAPRGGLALWLDF